MPNGRKILEILPCKTRNLSFVLRHSLKKKTFCHLAGVGGGGAEPGQVLRPAGGGAGGAEGHDGQVRRLP